MGENKATEEYGAWAAARGLEMRLGRTVDHLNGILRTLQGAFPPECGVEKADCPEACVDSTLRACAGLAILAENKVLAIRDFLGE